MVDWQDPTTLFISSRAFVLVCHMFFGVYLLEFCQSLRFDIEYIFGRRPKWGVSTILYFLARYTALAGFAVGVRIVNAWEEINCQPWMYAVFSLAYAAIALSLALLYIRVAEISSWSLRVVVPLGLIYCIYCALAVVGVIHVRRHIGGVAPQYEFPQVGAVAIPELLMCGPVLSPSGSADRYRNANTYLPLVALLFALACLGVMGTSLRYRGRRWVFLYLIYNGIDYVAYIALANLVAGIFLLAPLNDPASQAPGVLAAVITVISATRLQRDVLEAAQESDSETTAPIAFRGTDSGIELRVTIHVEQHAAREISLDVARDCDVEEKKSKDSQHGKEEI